MKRRLTRSKENKTIAGVCGGLSEYLDIDVTIIRVAFLIGIFTNGIGLIAYIIMWIATPVQSAVYSNGISSGFTIPENETDMYKSRRLGAIVVGISLIAVGVFTLLDRYIPELDFADYFPYLFIVCGIAVLGYGFTHRQRYTVASSTASTISQEESARYSTYSTNDTETTE